MATPAKILVVDDDPASRAMLSLSLSAKGYRVETAADGPRALEILRREPFDRLITDGVMRPMDGRELSVKARALRPAIRIAMVSAIYGDKDAADAPIERAFPKPVPLEDLFEWLAS